MLTLRTLGSLSILNSDGVEMDAILSQPKRSALLVYLAAARPQGFHRRDTLTGLFWPEMDHARARNALSQSLSFLRSHLPDDILVNRGAEDVQFSSASFALDVIEFRNAVQEKRWAKALEVFQGDFLKGFHLEEAKGFQDWMELERAFLREAAADAAWALAQEHISRGALVEAERMGQRAMGLVWSDETPVRKFISSLASGGDRAAAIRFYEKFRSRLWDELELEPSEATVAVAESIRLGSGDQEAPSSVPSFSATTLASVVPERVEVEGQMEEAPLEARSPIDRPPPADPVRSGRVRLSRWPIFGVLAVAGGAAGWIGLWDRGPSRPPPHTTFQQVTFDGTVGPAALSPNGEYLAYILRSAPPKPTEYITGDSPLRLMVKDLVGGTTLLVSDSILRIWELRWSPDGGRIGMSGLFESGMKTLFYPRLGGLPKQAPGFLQWFRWSPDGRRLAGWTTDAPRGAGILLVDLPSGQVDSLPVEGGESWAIGGDWSPDGGHLLMFTKGGPFQGHIRVISTTDGSEVTLTPDRSGSDNPTWDPSGNSFYFLRGDHLWSATVDRTPGGAFGLPRRVVSLEDLTWHFDSNYNYSISADARKLAYTRTSGYTNYFLVSGDPTGPVVPVQLSIGTAKKSCPVLSPDGRSLVFLAESVGLDVYVVSTGGGTPRKLTSGGFSGTICPAWSPSGGELALSTYAYNSRRLAILPVTGEPPRILGDTLLAGYLTWAGVREVAYPVRNLVNIRLRDPETGKERLLLEQDKPSITAPVSSPDGSKLAVWRSGDSATGLWSYSLQDGSPIHLTEADELWFPVGWSVEGDRIIARKSREGAFYWISLGSGEPSLIPGPELDGMDCVPHDREGGMVWVCTEEHSFSDVWIVDNFDLDGA